MIGITGASGRLGREVSKLLPDGVGIGRRIPSERFSVIFHCAGPRRIEESVFFDGFNLALRDYCHLVRPRLVVVGSCWQFLEGKTYSTDYAALKRKQTALFPEATHVIPYWIFGPQRGFIWSLVRALRGEIELSSAGVRPRDFISVEDVARDVLGAIALEPGQIVGSYSDNPVVPYQLAESFGLQVDRIEPEPSTILSYPVPRLSKPVVEVNSWIRRMIHNAEYPD